MMTIPALLDSTMPLASFLESYREGLIFAVGNSYPPVITQAGPLPVLLRSPLGRQHEAITATAASLQTHRNTLVVAEMGTGKSYLSIAAAHAAGMKRVLVMAPPHLVEKWAREVKATVPFAKTRILESIGDVDALRDYRDEAPLFVMLSREKAKLGHAWKPAYVKKKRFYKSGDGIVTLEAPTCAACGRVLETDEGLVTHEDLAKKKRTCGCGGPLWQADRNGPRRYPLAHYLTKKLKGFFDLLVLDELHELKAKGAAQGIAAGSLAEAIPCTLGLTGTIFGGYSSNLFYLLYRFSSQIREHYAYDDDTRFVQHYGVLERITRESYSEDGRVSRRQGRSTTTKERPGLSPAVLPHLLFNTVFLRLPDVAAALPPYAEEVEVLKMTKEQREVHLAFKSNLADEVHQQLACGSKKLLGAYLQSLMHHPDTPWRAETVTTVDEDGSARVVAHADALDDGVLYPKEERLLEIVRAEKRRGRKVLIFVQGTERRDITPRLTTLLAKEGVRAAVLKSHTVAAKKREAWVQKEVKAGLDALICHPRCVQTGLDLLDFPTLVFYQVEFSVFTLRQASRRSWRIGQEQAVKVIHLAYEETLQTQALALIAKKSQASLALEGELVEGGLSSMAEDDLMVSLAKSLVEGDDSAITSLSSAKSEDDEFVTALPDVSFMPIPFYAPEGTGAQAGVLESFPKEVIVELPSKDEGKPFDPLDVLGLTREAPIPPSPLLDTPISRPIVRVSFLDTAITLGKGKKKQVVHAGAGMLFPELIGTT